MKNADMPAMPIGQQMDSIFMNPACNGLTKREIYAMAAMQGLVTATMHDGMWSHDPVTAADAAVEYADALLKALELTK